MASFASCFSFLNCFIPCQLSGSDKGACVVRLCLCLLVVLVLPLLLFFDAHFAAIDAREDDLLLACDIL